MQGMDRLHVNYMSLHHGKHAGNISVHRYVEKRRRRRYLTRGEWMLFMSIFIPKCQGVRGLIVYFGS